MEGVVEMSPCDKQTTLGWIHTKIRWSQTYIIVLSQVHAHNVSQGEASLEDKQNMSFKAENIWLTDEVTSQKFHTNVH